MKNFLFALLTLFLLQNCSTLDHLAIQWKYRNDYKLPSNNVKSDNSFIELQVSAEQNATSIATIKTLPEINNLEKNSFDYQKSAILSNSKKRVTSHRKLFKLIQQSSITIDTPQPNKYYNNYYNAGTEKKVHPLARKSFLFGLLSFIPFGGLVLSFFAIITGGLGLYKIEKEPDLYSGRGFALTGLGLGILVLCLYAVLIFYILINNSRFFPYY